MLAKCVIIGQQVLNSPVTGLVLIYRTAVHGIGILVVHTRTSETTLLRRTEVQTDVDAVAQTLNPWALHLAEQGIIRTNTLVLAQPYILVALHGLAGHHGLIIGRHGYVALDVAIGIVRTGQRTHNEDVTHIVHALLFTIAVVSAQTEAEPLANLLIEVTTNRHTVVTLSRNNRLIVIVTCTEAVATAIGTTGNADVVVVTHTCLIIQILPVGIGIVALVE